MKIARKFTTDDTIVDIVEYDYTLLPFLSRFSLPLGFGNKSIAQVCEQSGVDVNVFLLIINYIVSGQPDNDVVATLNPLDIVDFLKNSHEYFLSYKFPHIRQNLLNALDESHGDINPAIVGFYDDFVTKATKHFRYEEKKLFPYVKALVNGSHSKYNIQIFCRQHDEVADSLSELKNIILRFYSTDVPNKMYDVLVDIYNCEEDMDSHSDIENHILVPMVEAIERRQSNEQ